MATNPIVPGFRQHKDQKMDVSKNREANSWVAAMIRPDCERGVGERASFVSRIFPLDVAPRLATMRITETTS